VSDHAKNEEELAEAHAMLDELGAPGRRGTGSVRERLGLLLDGFWKGAPLPDRGKVIQAQFSKPPTPDPSGAPGHNEVAAALRNALRARGAEPNELMHGAWIYDFAKLYSGTRTDLARYAREEVQQFLEAGREASR